MLRKRRVEQQAIPKPDIPALTCVPALSLYQVSDSLDNECRAHRRNTAWHSGSMFRSSNSRPRLHHIIILSIPCHHLHPHTRTTTKSPSIPNKFGTAGTTSNQCQRDSPEGPRQQNGDNYPKAGGLQGQVWKLVMRFWKPWPDQRKHEAHATRIRWPHQYPN